ncbi:MAG: Ferric reductase domain protein transrane component domain protein [Acidobacteria bacterium]|nr:Ferric reductase domain protein transrane component domain protein [Acidobacteriota bacterium]
MARPVRRLLKTLLFAASLLPLAWLVRAGLAGRLGANPLETVTHATGLWTLRFLLLTLAVTPLRRLSGWNAVIGYRRMLGLFAFFYGTLHLFTYLWFDQFFSWGDIVRDVSRRPFITAGMAAFAAMVPLALTSTAGMIRRLGGRRWRALHRLVYAAAAAGVAHYWWLVKADTRAPRAYAAGLAVLLLLRLLPASFSLRPAYELAWRFARTPRTQPRR